MRCLSCNTILTDFEATRRYDNTYEYIDLCNSCFRETDIKCATERSDLVGVTDEISSDWEEPMPEMCEEWK